MRIRLALLLLIPVLAGPAGAATERASVSAARRRFGPPVLWVARPAQPPVIDGRLDDGVWRTAQPVALRFLTGRWEAPTQKTEVRVLADEKAIYFAVKCHEAEPHRVTAAGERRDGPLWNGDTVEVFLDPGHKETRREYVQIVVNPRGLVYDSRNGNARWNASLAVKTGTFDGGWTVELAVPMADLGVAGAIPRVWGLNINRQRPELGEIAPVRGIRGHYEKLKDPGKYREGEDTAWSPTYCHSSHTAQRFGHAVLEAGTIDVKPPERLFEVIFRSNFDDGKVGPFEDGAIADENFRGPGKSLTPRGGAGTIYFRHSLKDLDDVTLIMALKMPQNGRLYYYGRAPDNEQCEADRHEVFMTPEQTSRRKFPAMDDYDTHGSMMAWKSHGRLRAFPGPWAMMTGHFSEPSIGSVMQPGTGWAILRTRLGQFRRQTSQGMVPLEQNYPNGLVFHAGRQPFLIDELVIFRGTDLEPPTRVAGLEAERQGDKVVLRWSRSSDNTITACYRAYDGQGKVVAETHRLSVALKAAEVSGRSLAVTALDLYGNESLRSAPVRAP